MSATIDQQFVEFIVKTIVSKPDEVQIKRTIDEKGVLLELTVNQEDLGRVIGKRGTAAQALRTLLRALGTKNDARYNLKIVDPEGDSRPKKDFSSEKTTEYNKSEEKSEETKAEITEQSKDRKIEEVKEEPSEEKQDSKSSFEKTRRELADLDDLDI